MQASTSPMISAILAMSQNRVIGSNNQLPWHLPADLKHFKALTTGNAILMGRKTYESIGKPLPNRTNIVVTRDKHFKAQGVIVKHTFKEGLEFANDSNKKEFFIIGGAQIFQQAMPYIRRIYLTIIHHDFQGDTFFPIIDKKKWKEVECISYFADEVNPYAYSFIVLEAAAKID